MTRVIIAFSPKKTEKINFGDPRSERSRPKAESGSKRGDESGDKRGSSTAPFGGSKGAEPPG